MLSKLPRYPKEKLERHKAAHKMYVGKIKEFQTKFDSGDLPTILKLVSGDLVNFLKSWLSGHI